MWDFVKSVFSWLGSESIAASLTRVAIGVGLMRYLNKANENASPTNSASTPQGIRQQIPPATDNKIPIVYGDAYLGGTIIDVQLVNDNKELYAVLALCEKTGDLFSTSAQSNITIDGVYLNNNRITFKSDGTTMDYTTDDTGVQDTGGSGLVGIYLYKGDSSSPMLPCQPGTTTPIIGTVPPAAYSIMPGWGSSHTMSNIIFAIVKMNYDPSKGLRSIPNLKFHVRNTLKKPGDVLHDYMTNVMYGGGVVESTISSSGITALNAYSAESVSYPGHAAQERYVINGVVRTTESVMSNMQRIAGAAGSNVTYDISSGLWSVVINKATSKTLDFDDSNIIGQIAVTGTALDGYYNSVEVQFPYAYLRDQMNFVRVDLPEILRNSNEPDNQLQITHELVNNVVQATVLGNMDLRNSREDLAITFDTDYSKFNIQVGDVIGITNSVYSWTSKEFRVIRVKKNESDTGRLTLQITAQSYNADVYTVESIDDFTPLIGAGHSIPNLGAIQRPDAPTVDIGSTISSQPSITLEATVPSGVVTEMEFWYTPDDTEPNDNLRRYYLLGTTRSENSGPFTTGATTSFKTVLLQTDNYYFKVRAGNQYGTSQFSYPSSMIPFVYTQAPDVLPYQTPAVDANGNTLDQDGEGLNWGMIAMYVASKLNWGNILSGNVDSLSSLFGISSNAAQTVKDTVVGDSTRPPYELDPSSIPKSFQTVNGEVLATTSTNFTIQGGNNIVVSTNPTTNTIVISGVCCDDPNVPPPPTTHTSTISGKVFPCVYGSGPTMGSVDSRAGIFTHDHLVFGGSGASAKLKTGHTISNSTTISSTISGRIQRFYNIPNITTGTWSKKPAYDETATDQFEANTKVSLYYATATYTGGNLDAQSWSNWHLIDTDNGTTGHPASDAYTYIQTIPAVWSNVWTNPLPTTTFDVEESSYVIEETYHCTGNNEYILEGNILTSPTYLFGGVDTDSYKDYDPFKPNVYKTTLVTEEQYVPVNVPAQDDTRVKVRDVTASNLVSYSGGTNSLIIFGTSIYNLPDGTPFSNNTVFGHADSHIIEIWPDAIALRDICNNGSRFVGINVENDGVYFSDDGLNWTRIERPTYVTINNAWADDSDSLNDIPPFRFLVYDGSKFLAYNTQKRVATSTDGQNWVEYEMNIDLDDSIMKVIAAPSHYLAVGLNGVQYSTDGITWGALTLSSVFNGRGPNCGTWDGSKFIVGGRQYLGQSSAFWTTTDGSTFTSISSISNPSVPINASVNTTYSDELSFYSYPTVGVMP